MPRQFRCTWCCQPLRLHQRNRVRNSFSSTAINFALPKQECSHFSPKRIWCTAVSLSNSRSQINRIGFGVTVVRRPITNTFCTCSRLQCIIDWQRCVCGRPIGTYIYLCHLRCSVTTIMSTEADKINWNMAMYFGSPQNIERTKQKYARTEKHNGSHVKSFGEHTCTPSVFPFSCLSSRWSLFVWSASNHRSRGVSVCVRALRSATESP